MANTTTYNPKSIEPKWQKYWEEHGTFKTDVWDFSKPKYYALDMFPYPSGVGLHADKIKRSMIYPALRDSDTTEWDMIHLDFQQNSML